MEGLRKAIARFSICRRFRICFSLHIILFPTHHTNPRISINFSSSRNFFLAFSAPRTHSTQQHRSVHPLVRHTQTQIVSKHTIYHTALAFWMIALRFVVDLPNCFFLFACVMCDDTTHSMMMMTTAGADSRRATYDCNHVARWRRNETNPNILSHTHTHTCNQTE